MTPTVIVTITKNRPVYKNQKGDELIIALFYAI